MTVPRPTPPATASAPSLSAAPDAREASRDLSALTLRSQGRSNDRAATLLEQMAANDPQMRSHHLAAATRFRKRAELCRDLLRERSHAPADDAAAEEVPGDGR